MLPCKKHVKPPGYVQCRNADVLNRAAHIEGRPVLIGLIVVQPVEDVRGNARTVNSRVRAKGNDSGLRREIGPGLLQAVARLAKREPPARLP